MSKHDLDKYYNEVCAQYHDFLEEIKDFDELCALKLIAPEIVTAAKKTFEPVKQNWLMLNYIMYLINKPVRKKKHSWYDKQTYEQVSNSITSTLVIEQNNEAKKQFNTIINK